MSVRTDPEGHETDALFDLVELEGREVQFRDRPAHRGIQLQHQWIYLPCVLQAPVSGHVHSEAAHVASPRH
jgi:hypothetical protein